MMMKTTKESKPKPLASKVGSAIPLLLSELSQQVFLRGLDCPFPCQPKSSCNCLFERCVLFTCNAMVFHLGKDPPGRGFLLYPTTHFTTMLIIQHIPQPLSCGLDRISNGNSFCEEQ
jgi:hypothetical protein